MFKSARFKLTGWYLLIIMAISVFFSALIYAGAVKELERGFRRVELRFSAEELDIPLRLRELTPRFFSAEDLEAVKKRLRWNLLAVNGAILGISALAGYFLAGKTLKPIETALEEQKRFVTDASHELRTPLTVLKTSMEVALRDKKLSLQQAKTVIKSNLKDINTLQSLSNRLLNLANLQSNGRNFVFENIDIASVIKSACRKISFLAKKKNIEIKTKIKNQIIEANKESLEQMMLIFLDNAVKYTLPKGKITVKTKTDKKHLILEIKDTGIGIAEKDLPYIFDRFYRADQSRAKNGFRDGRLTLFSGGSRDSLNARGFGLGLSLAKKIIEIHQGSVSVKSDLSKGTTFIIKLAIKHS